MSPRGTVPISGMIEEQMDKCLIWNQSDFLEQPLVIILVLKTQKKNCLDIGRKPTVSLVSDMAHCSLCPLVFFLT